MSLRRSRPVRSPAGICRRFSFAPLHHFGMTARVRWRCNTRPCWRAAWLIGPTWPIPRPPALPRRWVQVTSSSSSSN